MLVRLGVDVNLFMYNSTLRRITLYTHHLTSPQQNNMEGSTTITIHIHTFLSYNITTIIIIIIVVKNTRYESFSNVQQDLLLFVCLLLFWEAALTSVLWW